MKLARWESKSSKYWIELELEETYGSYGYRGKTCGGCIVAASPAGAVEYIEQRILPSAQPDANKTPMIRVA